MDITIAVATFGSNSWKHLANRRAIPSAKQFGVPVVTHHGTTLHDSRNACLEQVKTEFIVYLDGDDELEPGFIDAMEKGTCDVRAPAVRYVRGNVKTSAAIPRVWSHTHDCVAECLPKGNWLVVGSVVRADLVRAVGGWKDWPVYEDWDLWLRCYLAGATFKRVPQAIYRAYVMPTSRNRSLGVGERDKIHYKIIESVGL